MGGAARLAYPFCLFFCFLSPPLARGKGGRCRQTAAQLVMPSVVAMAVRMPNLLALIILLIIISATMEAIRAMASKWTPTRRICRRSTTESPTLP